ncbi:YiiX/YebB-like N1pC/P60 family cysteine hydrolase [Zhongshania sp.]|uniref:YiiX/YebB-like N1pC/P60 family cysteine hydrolase n=1 Tax=Zhongshania sp. TaxID=1971902 RepID=UPI00356A19A7
MNQLISFFIFVLSSAIVHSSELRDFEKNLTEIKSNSSLSANKRHLAIYQHTLELGVHGVDYLVTRRNVNGLFVALVKDSWEAYIAASDNLLKLSRQRSEEHQALAELYLIERTQALYNKYMESISYRFILKDQSLILDNKIEIFIENILSRSNRNKLPYLLGVVARKKPRGYENSLIYQKFDRGESLEGFATLDFRIIDALRKIFYVSTGTVSRSLGAVAGPIEWGRSGRVSVDVQLKNNILAKLMPLDIVFEKKSNKLTDYLIPGYWGHNAVWLGTKEQLIELGIWESKELAPFRDNIENGNSIFEIRRQGAGFSRFDDWLEMDAFASIRVKGLLDKSESRILKVYRILSEQFGKEYDFGFNVDTSYKVTCSELVYLAYGDYQWPTRSMLGRTIVGPNEIAELVFYKDAPLELISFVTSGEEEAPKFQEKEILANLMGFNLQSDGTFKKRYKVCYSDGRVHIRDNIRIKRRCVEKEKYLYLQLSKT